MPPLPDSGSFGLKGWSSLSPPSNFAFPEAFDPPLLLKPKDTSRLAGQVAAGAAGVAGGPDAGGGGATGASDAAGLQLSLGLGPTDFSQLFASMDVQPEAPAAGAAAAAGTGAAGAAGAGSGAGAAAAAASAGGGSSRGLKAPAAGVGPTLIAQSAVDALFGQAGCGIAAMFGSGGGAGELGMGVVTALAGDGQGWCS